MRASRCAPDPGPSRTARTAQISSIEPTTYQSSLSRIDSRLWSLQLSGASVSNSKSTATPRSPVLLAIMPFCACHCVQL
jgi:hypothetical protein